MKTISSLELSISGETGFLTRTLFTVGLDLESFLPLLFFLERLVTSCSDTSTILTSFSMKNNSFTSSRGLQKLLLESKTLILKYCITSLASNCPPLVQVSLLSASLQTFVAIQPVFSWLTCCFCSF